MDLNIEKGIVNLFYQKKYRDRIIWELETPRRRTQGISKMGKREYLDEKKLCQLPYLEIAEFIKQVSTLGGTHDAYFISIDSYYRFEDFPQKISITDALNMARHDISGCILYFGNGIGYYHEGEPYDVSMEYILSAHPVKCLNDR